MNLTETVKTMADGLVNLTTWVGTGGVVVSPDVAQSRANICLTGNGGKPCSLNQEGLKVTQEVADATRKFLEFKNKLKLKVRGEHDLHSCIGCGCVLRLLVWQPQERVKSQMTTEEAALTPEFCWKLKQ